MAVLAHATPPALQEELVPEGAWLLRIGVSSDTQDTAFSRADKERPLLHYLVPDDSVRGQISGSVQRDVQRTELLFTYGYTDSWNLALTLPFVRVDQTSTATTGSVDPTVQAEVARLASDSVSGLGRVRLASLHRPVFSDRHGFVLAYGYDWVASDPERPWNGVGTLHTDVPYDGVFGLLHYTLYPYIRRARFDFRAELQLGLDTPIGLADGSSQSLVPPDRVTISLGWQQELGPVLLGLAAAVFQQGQNRIAGAEQQDGVDERAVILTLGYGNLGELETGRPGFPYQLLLTVERSAAGFNTPIRDEVQLSLQTYF